MNRRRRGEAWVSGIVVLAAASLACVPSAWGAEGDLDPSFGSGGTATTLIGPTAEAFAMEIDSQGRIVVAGSTGDTSGGGTDVDMAVTRYLPNGTLDPSFSNDGIATFGFPGVNSRDVASSIAFDSAGRIIVAGWSNSQSTYDFAMIRVNADGTRDVGFGPAGSNGFVTRAITSGQNDQAEGVAIDSQGRIVLGGWTFNSDYDFVAARFDANGVLDTSFGTGGTRAVDFTPFANDQDLANAMAIDAQDRIVLAGLSTTTGGGDFALVRLTSGGSRDPSFGPNTNPDQQGQVTASFGATQDQADGLTIDPAGKLLATGITGSPLHMALARFNADGSLDTSFSDDGKLVNPSIREGRDVAVDPQGRILAAGVADRFAVARYFSDGGVDQSFGVGGVATAPGGYDNAGDIAEALDDHDRIVVAGANLRSDNATWEFGLARFIGDAIAPPPATISSGPADGAIINDPTPTFEFASTDVGAGYACGFQGAVSTCASPFTPGTPLADGSHTFAVSATDRAGNASAPATRTFTVDTVAPDITIKGKKKLETDAKKAKEKLKIKTSEPAELTCAIDKKKPKPCGEKFKAKLKLGRHKVTIEATDLAGNSSDEAKKVKVVSEA